MKGYATFPKASGLDPHYQIQFSIISRSLGGGSGGASYPSTEVHLMYSTAPFDKVVVGWFYGMSTIVKVFNVKVFLLFLQTIIWFPLTSEIIICEQL